MDAAAVRAVAGDLPSAPGVYQFHGSSRTLYVGKAVDLQDRVRSYADPRSARIARMVRAAEDLEVAVTDTETQALLLEANLIKRHQPKYNVRLKDDKSYPMVQLTDHEAPRIEVTRDPAEAATVFGPFTDKGRVDTVVKAIREIFGLRGCSDHKYAGRDRPCLDYELGLCTAPCTEEIELEEYRDDVARAQRYLEGGTGALAEPLEAAMEQAASNANYERAAHLRDQLAAATALHGAGGAAVHGEASERTVDVLGVAIEGERATVARLRAEQGKLVERDRHHLEMPSPDRSDAVGQALSAFLVQYYAERALPDALLLPEPHGDEEVTEWLEVEGVAVRVPGAGREATLVELALTNARRHGPPDDGAARLAEALDCGPIERIEGFDVSHAQGRATVGSNVTFLEGQPWKEGYRRKRLDDRNDDVESMAALLEWRARRAVEGRDDRPDPDLLLIDGGETQLAAARKTLESVGWAVPVVALAKAEELVVTADGVRNWPRDASHLHLLQRVRDEAHRFAVQYHQTVRDDVATVLDDVPGIGPSVRKRLLGRFGSVENIRTASMEELRSVPGVGQKRAETILARL